MSAEQVCPACGYHFSDQPGKRASFCPRCRTALGTQPQKAPDTVPPIELQTAGDLSDLEFSDESAAKDVIAEESFPTTRREKKPDDKEITNRQEKDSQEAHLAVQQHLAAAPLGSIDTEPEQHPSETSIPKAVPSRKQPAPTSHPAPKTSVLFKLISTFGPVLLVCVLFLGWVVWDRVGRPREISASAKIELILSQAVLSYQKGDFQGARKLAAQALREDPTSELAKNLAQMFEERK